MTGRPPAAAELAAMRRALALAATPGVPLGPNPRVGCVLLAPDGHVVGEGFHHGAGTPHAEVEALRAAGADARGATAVVTLEPCSHTGRTGPCTLALIEAGVTRVVHGQTDLHPQAAGGAEVLRAAGVEVVGGVLADEAAALNPAWTFAMRQGRPLVTWKAAATLDGRVAAADGTSRWITSPEARAEVHALRDEVDAVLVGTGTARSDDPHLTARRGDGSLRERQPLRCVMGLGELPASLRLFDDAAPTLVLDTRDPAEALARLTQREVVHVLLEGGPRLAGAFVAAGLVDRVRWYLAPALLGAGAAALVDAGITTMAQALRLDVVDVVRVGPDLRIDARVRREEG